MTTPNNYFLQPWSNAASDDVAIPVTGAATGALSYQYGFTPNYEYDLLTNPSALPIPRTYTNQLFLDITTALQQLQKYGAPLWVAPGSGGPANYPINARVLYTTVGVLRLWESQVAANTSVPGADANWFVVSAQGKMVQSLIASPGTVLTSGAPSDITTLVLPPGNWNVWGNMAIDPVGTSTSSFGWISLSSGSSFPGFQFATGEVDATGMSVLSFNLPALNINLSTASGNTTIYIAALSSFSGGACNAYGNFYAQGI